MEYLNFRSVESTTTSHDELHQTELFELVEELSKERERRRVAETRLQQLSITTGQLLRQRDMASRVASNGFYEGSIRIPPQFSQEDRELDIECRSVVNYKIGNKEAETTKGTTLETKLARSREKSVLLKTRLQNSVNITSITIDRQGMMLEDMIIHGKNAKDNMESLKDKLRTMEHSLQQYKGQINALQKELKKSLRKQLPIENHLKEVQNRLDDTSGEKMAYKNFLQSMIEHGQHGDDDDDEREDTGLLALAICGL
jgi:hypothetical protein